MKSTHLGLLKSHRSQEQWVCVLVLEYFPWANFCCLFRRPRYFPVLLQSPPPSVVFSTEAECQLAIIPSLPPSCMVSARLL